MNQLRMAAAAGVLFMAAACAGGKETAEVDTSSANAAAASDTVPTAGLQTGANAMLDPNNATAADLMTLPSMDSATVNTVIAGRPYANMIALNNKLTRLSKSQRDSLYTRMFIPIDINKATSAEIDLIPGVGKKMVHEFEEYRPWTSIGQFRREIGKYVDSTEVARLERYITLR